MLDHYQPLLDSLNYNNITLIVLGGAFLTDSTKSAKSAQTVSGVVGKLIHIFGLLGITFVLLHPTDPIGPRASIASSLPLSQLLRSLVQSTLHSLLQSEPRL